jgi:hypothetical protein
MGFYFPAGVFPGKHCMSALVKPLRVFQIAPIVALSVNYSSFGYWCNCEKVASVNVFVVARRAVA